MLYHKTKTVNQSYSYKYIVIYEHLIVKSRCKLCTHFQISTIFELLFYYLIRSKGILHEVEMFKTNSVIYELFRTTFTV